MSELAIPSDHWRRKSNLSPGTQVQLNSTYTDLDLNEEYPAGSIGTVDTVEVEAGREYFYVVFPGGTAVLTPDDDFIVVSKEVNTEIRRAKTKSASRKRANELDMSREDFEDLLRTEWQSGTDPNDYERGDPVRDGLIALKNGYDFETAMEHAGFPRVSKRRSRVRKSQWQTEHGAGDRNQVHTLNRGGMEAGVIIEKADDLRGEYTALWQVYEEGSDYAADVWDEGTVTGRSMTEAVDAAKAEAERALRAFTSRVSSNDQMVGTYGEPVGTRIANKVAAELVGQTAWGEPIYEVGPEELQVGDEVLASPDTAWKVHEIVRQGPDGCEYVTGLGPQRLPRGQTVRVIRQAHKKTAADDFALQCTRCQSRDVVVEGDGAICQECGLEMSMENYDEPREARRKRANEFEDEGVTDVMPGIQEGITDVQEPDFSAYEDDTSTTALPGE